MKILMIFPYPPLPPPMDLAGTKRNLPFFIELAKYNDVSVLTIGNEAEEKLFKSAYSSHCKSIHFIKAKRPRIINGLLQIFYLITGRSSFRQIVHPKMQSAIDELAYPDNFNIIHCCVQFLGYYNFPKGIPITSDTHEVKYSLIHRVSRSTKNLLLKAMLYWTYKMTKKEELVLCTKFDTLIATTEVDKALFHQDIPDQNIVVVQNGAGYEFFEPLNIQQIPLTMVFTGLFTHRPNSEGIIWFLDNVFPRILEVQPNVKLYIVGKDPTREMLARKSNNVVITGFVDDVRPYIARAQIFIIPLLAGGGIRGKALEAMAMKKAIVTTTIGVEGIHLEDRHSALFADEPEAFSKAVLELFSDSELRTDLSQNAYSTAVSKYDWNAKGRELNQILEETILESKSQYLRQRNAQ